MVFLRSSSDSKCDIKGGCHLTASSNVLKKNKCISATRSCFLWMGLGHGSVAYLLFHFKGSSAIKHYLEVIFWDI